MRNNRVWIVKFLFLFSTPPSSLWTESPEHAIATMDASKLSSWKSFAQTPKYKESAFGPGCRNGQCWRDWKTRNKILQSFLVRNVREVIYFRKRLQSWKQKNWDRDFCVESPWFLLYQSVVYFNKPKKGASKELCCRVVGEVKQENLV